MPSDISMSVSPQGHTPGDTPGRTPNGAPKFIKRKPAADPLVRRKDNRKRPPSDHPLKANGSLPRQSNGTHTNPHQPSLHHSQQVPSPVPRTFDPKSPNAVSGFSSQNIAPFQDFELRLSKRDLVNGFKFHVARFASKRNIDPRNSEEFVRPVRLHRRDARPSTRQSTDQKHSDGGEDAKDSMLRAVAKAERDAKREAENAKVAPSVKSNRGPNIKKTEQVLRTDLTAEQQAKAKLHYEEALPWHLEDFDGNSVWVGNYEEALSNMYGMLVLGADGVFRITPLEKWYKFAEKSRFAVLGADEAEALMKRKIKEPRWFMDSQLAAQERDKEAYERKAAKGLFVGKWERGGGGSGAAKPLVKQENADADDLDFVEDRFADDEENMLFEEDDETKEAEERIKKDQLQANVFDLKEEKEYEKQEELENKEREAERKLGKRVKKALKKREKNYIYDSDSSNPYSSGSNTGSDSSATVARRKAENEGKDTPKSTPDKPEKSKLSTKMHKTSSGRATPSQRPSKHSNNKDASAPISRVASSSNLKRPGSPLASDVSGNESSRSRKRAKKGSKVNQASQPSQGNLQVPSRPGSPPLSVTSSSMPASGPLKRRAGNGSDTEAVSGGEMSDAARARKKAKLKLKMRASSPDLGGRGESPGAAIPPSQASAPSPPAGSPSPPPVSTLPVPTGAEIRAKIPPEGITINDLLKHFPGRATGKERFSQFQTLLKSNSRFDRARKILLPLN